MTAQSARSRPGAWAKADWLVLAGLALVVIIARAQTFGDPVLGFDEQYYLLVADRMLHGAVPYVDIWDRKPIGLFLLYAGAIVPGGDPFLNYKLLAAGFVLATAVVIYRAARQDAGRFGAIIAALLYVLWLNFMEGEGGQAPVFYNLPVLLAAVLTRQAVVDGRRLVRGCLALLLVGLAIQLKYTAMFEGIAFGLMLLWAQFRTDRALGRLAGCAAIWIVCALAPTAVAFAVYAGMGQAEAFLFANFQSIFGRLPDPALDRLGGFAVIVALTIPLGIVAALEWRRTRALSFWHMWAVAAALGMLAVGSFLSPSYAMPLLAPLCLSAAAWFGNARRGRIVGAALVALGLVGGVLVVRQVIIGKGTRDEALQVAAAAQPRQGCIWVYDGYPALYLLTHSCVPTRWAFPGHLNTLDEASPAAIGVDPVSEVRRILATRPDVIVDNDPAYRLGNRDTRAVVERELARSYRLTARVQTGPGRYRMVYRLR
ncbi:glycosyltransferase family 39 protein [Novosphingobium sp.]|uniref:ArnT family glycosyltransferase n=1 Tax=Novosphingobium sp. TaxID=1874826 RepID=UPI0025D06935|nr:glycosyltransferase family 39 protein [Novosphingobium sp.]